MASRAHGLGHTAGSVRRGPGVYGAVEVKVVDVRSGTAPGWLLPVAGGLPFTAQMVVVDLRGLVAR